MPGVRNIPVGYLRERMAEVPPDTPVVVHCQAGGRSAIAASVLQAGGFRDVADVPGGFAEWEAAGLSVERAGRSAPDAAA
jgi:hydroxyacylglutathione hydrolase